MTKVNVTLLISSACPHCASVLQGVCELVKQGKIGAVEVTNITVQPDAAQQYGVRSVPYLRIGAFEFSGLISRSDMVYWVEQATSETGLMRYFDESLKSGELNKVLKLVNSDSDLLAQLLTLMQDASTELAVRVGIGAVLEDFEGSKALLAQFDRLAELTRHGDYRVRLDACHYLTLTHSPQAKPIIEALLNDENPEVREVANDSLEELDQQ